MKLQVYTLDISALHKADVLSCYKRCVSEHRRQKAERLKVHADQARTIGAGILLAIAYEQFQNRCGESAKADSLFACDLFAYQAGREGVRLLQTGTMEQGLKWDCDKNCDKYCDNTKNGECSFVRGITIEELCKLKDGLPMEQEGLRGKPYFANGPCFSISHARDMVSLVMGERETGIDVEYLRAYQEAVAKRCFLDEEMQLIFEHPQKKDVTFTQIWTRKEAMVKLTGDGMGGIMEKKKPDGIYMKSIWLNEYYVLTVAIAKE